MNTRHSIILSVILCLVLTFSVAMPEEAEPAVRVGEITYGTEEIQAAYNLQIAAYTYYGIELAEEEQEALLEAVARDYVQRGLVENLIRQAGLDRLSDNEKELLLESARETYDDLWVQTRESADGSIGDADITASLTAGGITVDELYRELFYGETVARLLESRGLSAEISDEELADFFDEYYVAPCRERYENNIPLFEAEVLTGTEDSFYMPEGYRLLRQIVLPVPEKNATEIAALETEINEKAEQAETLYRSFADTAVRGETVPEADREAYLVLVEEYDRLTAAYTDAWAMVLPTMKDQTDEIRQRLSSGESFDSLQAACGGNDGDLYWHPEGDLLSDELAEGAQTLEHPGDISQPCLCPDGIHILYYAEDIPGGPMSLDTEEERNIVREAAVRMKLSELLNDLTTGLEETWPVTIRLENISR